MNKYEKIKEALLDGGGAHALEALESSGGGITELTAFLYDDDAATRFRAVKAIGIMAEKKALKNRLEELRESIRRLFWTMNHESGATGWRSADAIGAIASSSRILSGEYAKLLMLHRNDPAFETSVFRAIASISEKHPEAIKEFVPDLESAAASSNPETKFWALLSMFRIGACDIARLKNELSKERATIAVFNAQTEEMISAAPVEIMEILLTMT